MQVPFVLKKRFAHARPQHCNSCGWEIKDSKNNWNIILWVWVLGGCEAQQRKEWDRRGFYCDQESNKEPQYHTHFDWIISRNKSDIYYSQEEK